jgi:hypothetical protein
MSPGTALSSHPTSSASPPRLSLARRGTSLTDRCSTHSERDRNRSKQPITRVYERDRAKVQRRSQVNRVIRSCTRRGHRSAPGATSRTWRTPSRGSRSRPGRIGTTARTRNSRSNSTASIAKRIPIVWIERQPVRSSPSFGANSVKPRRPRRLSRRDSAIRTSIDPTRAKSIGRPYRAAPTPAVQSVTVAAFEQVVVPASHTTYE